MNYGQDLQVHLKFFCESPRIIAVSFISKMIDRFFRTLQRTLNTILIIFDMKGFGFGYCFRLNWFADSETTNVYGIVQKNYISTHNYLTGAYLIDWRVYVLYITCLLSIGAYIFFATMTLFTDLTQEAVQVSNVVPESAIFSLLSPVPMTMFPFCILLGSSTSFVRTRLPCIHKFITNTFKPKIVIIFITSHDPLSHFSWLALSNTLVFVQLAPSLFTHNQSF